MAEDLISTDGLHAAGPQDTTVSMSPEPSALHGAPALRLAADAIPGYAILGEVSRGGQGVVFEATQQSTQRRVAIKVLKEGPFAGPVDKARFDREARILAQLQHPSIVTIHDGGVAAGCYYLVMDFVPGRPLDEFVAAKFCRPARGEHDPPPLQPEISPTLQLFVRICDAVAAAHDRGVMHRDLKPRNILVTEDGVPHVLDFGLAKMSTGSDSPGTGMTSLTGEFFGSLPWSSPEQARGGQKYTDVRTDVYSLGVILYQLLTGRFPYDVTAQLGEVLRHIASTEPIRPGLVNIRIRRELETILLKALEKEPQRRYQTAGELGADLRRYLAGEPVQARRQSFAYLLRKRTGVLARRNVVMCDVGVVLLALAIARFLVTPIVFNGTDLDRRFRNQVLPSHYSLSGERPLDSVRIVGLTEATDIEGVARREGLATVRRLEPRSLRALHGRLMEKLASSAARVVVFDIKFAAPSPFDDDFVRGAKALKSAGIPVVIAAAGWWFDTPPQVSPTIVPFVRWGSDESGFDASGAWRLIIAHQRGSAEALPTLSLAVFAAMRSPGAEVSITFSMPDESVLLSYWQTNPRFPGTKQYLARTDRLKLGEIRTAEADIPATGCLKGDVFGQNFISIPPDDVLDSIRTEYQQAISASPAELRGMCEDRIVVIADMRPGVDRHPHRDGRSLPGCYGQAVGIDSLVRAVSMHRVRNETEYAAMGLGAILGCIAGGSFCRRNVLRPLTLAGLIALAVGISAGVCRAYGVWCDPLIPVAAMILACELGGFTHRWLNRTVALGVEKET